MNKKRISLIVVVLCTCILCAVLYLFSNIRSYQGNNCLKAAPLKSNLIIQFTNLYSFFNSLELENHYFKDLDVFEPSKNLSLFIKELDSVAFVKDFLSRRGTVSFCITGKEKISALFLFELKNRAEESELYSNLLKHLSLSEIKYRSYNSSKIYSVKLFSSDRTFFFSINKGIFCGSYSSLLVENSLRQLQSSTSLLDDIDFMKLRKTVSKSALANVYINFSTFPKLLYPILNDDKSKLDYLSSMSAWAEFDIDLKENQIVANGFLIDEEKKSVLNYIFKDQDPIRSQVFEVLPSNTRFLQSFSFSHPSKLCASIKQISNESNLSLHLTEFQKQKGFDYIEALYSVIDQEIALAYGDVNDLEPLENIYLVIKSNSATKLKAILNDIIDSGLKPVDNFRIDNEVAFPIYSGLESEIINNCFGLLFKSCPSSYFCIYKNYLIIANSKKSIGSFLYSNVLHKTLDKDSNFESFRNQFSNKENYFLFAEVSHCYNLFKNELSKDILSHSEIEKSAIGKFYGFGLQLSTLNDLLYSNICLNYQPNRQNEPRTIWQSHLDSTVNNKPILVENHYSKEKEILVQDDANNLYLISNSGRILWKKRIDNPIISNFYQIDFYKNNKLQYLFNTKDKIYILDRNGNYVDKYPVKLPFKATSGLSLVDYDNARNYRIFIALEDHKIHLFDKIGNRLVDWNSPLFDSECKTSVQYFRVKDKDYIVVSDEVQCYILDRRGSVRVHLEEIFSPKMNAQFDIEFSEDIAYLVTVNNLGHKIKINLKNGQVETNKFVTFTEEFGIALKDINNNGLVDFIYVFKDKIIAISDSGGHLFEHKFDGELLLNADFYEFSSNNTKIGLTDMKNHQIYIINNDGSFYDGFPLKGRSRFSIGFLKSGSYRFNLICGGDNGDIYNYRVE